MPYRSIKLDLPSEADNEVQEEGNDIPSNKNNDAKSGPEYDSGSTYWDKDNEDVEQSEDIPVSMNDNVVLDNNISEHPNDDERLQDLRTLRKNWMLMSLRRAKS